MNKRLLAILSLLVITSMVLAACGTSNQPAEPVGPTAEDCAETETHMAEVIEMAEENKTFYESTVKTRKSAEYLVAGNFGFEIKDLDAPMPSEPFVVFPPRINVDESCSALDIYLALGVAGKALDISNIYLNAAKVEGAITIALLKMMDQQSLSLEQYNALIKQAAESVPPSQ